jgi:hypothetical protein
VIDDGAQAELDARRETMASQARDIELCPAENTQLKRQLSSLLNTRSVKAIRLYWGIRDSIRRRWRWHRPGNRDEDPAQMKAVPRIDERLVKHSAEPRNRATPFDAGSFG